MITGINPNEVVDYVAQNDTENPTVWGIGVLLTDEKNSFLGDAFGPKGELIFKNMLGKIEPILKCGLKRVKNYQTQAAGPVADYDPIPPALIQTIPYEVQIELLQKIIEVNFVSRAEIKN